MATFTNKESLYYNDVNIIAKKHDYFISRNDIPNESWRIIASPMQAVVGEKFVIEAARLGISVFLPRFLGREWQLDRFRSFYKNAANKNQFCCVSLGVKDFKQDYEFFRKNKVNNMGLDIANGYLNLVTLASYMKEGTLDRFYVGNVHDEWGYKNIYRTFPCISRELIVRVGIGGGSPCSTSDMTGVNRGNITEIMECSIWDTPHVSTAADGGISKPAYACKAFAAGAKYVIIGGYFSQAEEAETNVSGDGSYWGGASEKQLEIIKQAGKTSKGKILSPKTNLVPLKKLVDDLNGGIRSFVSYSGGNTLTEVIGTGLFEVKRNSLPPKNR